MPVNQTSAAPVSLTLYMYQGCSYCRKVMQTIETLALPIKLRDILKTPAYRQELRREGGRGTVPCLRIEYHDGRVEWLYESNVIIRYLRQKRSATIPS